MNRDLRLVLLLYVVAVNLRLVPLLLSGLPLNIDGFPLARIALDVRETGAWGIDPSAINAYNQKMPVYAVFWAALSLLGGVDVLRGLALLMPFVTSIAVVAVYALVLRVTAHRGVAFAAGLFLAVLGSFVFLTASIMKESLGLVLLPLALLAFHLRADPRMRVLAASLLAFLPLLHHLTFLMALGAVTILLVVDHHRRIADGTARVHAIVADVLTGPATAILAVAYYTAVDLELFRQVTAPDQVVLFLAVVFLFAVAAVRLAGPSRAASRPRGATRHVNAALLVPAATLGAFLLNRDTRVFAGTLPTQDAFLAVVPALAFLGVLAAIGFGVVRATDNRARPFLVAILLAPLAVIAFAFLRGLDPLSFGLVYRSLDYLDLGFALAAGVGLAVLWRSARRPFRAVLAVAFVAALLATTPMAYASESVFGVQNVTYEYEFAALGFASAARGPLGSDQRLTSVAAWWFGVDGDATAVLRIDRGEALSAYGAVLLEGRWTSTGAQLHPAPNLVLDPGTFDRVLADNHVVYAGGVPDNPVVIVVPRS